MQTTKKPKRQNGARKRRRKPELPDNPTKDRVGDRRRQKARSTRATCGPIRGVLELHPKGYGFLRNSVADYRPSSTDVYVAHGLINRLGLRPGNAIYGLARRVRNGGGPQLQEVYDIDGCSPGAYCNVREFAALTPINPNCQLRLETGPQPLSTRVIDLLVPLGKGQRAVVVAPPRTGKTVLLQQIGQGIGQNYPEVKLIVLLIDERPEEVTDMRRNICGEVLASSLDRDVESHVRLSRLVVERCKRLVEQGQDVLLLVDSLTRMSRACNKWVGSTGRTMTGGLDIKALDIPKKLFATARAFAEGGSLTILATALIETGSRMDDLIFAEFKGTGNLELVMDPQLAARRIWPAIDITRSGTRREELLLDPETLRATTVLRRALDSTHQVEAMERLKVQLTRYPTNRDFLQMIDQRRTRVA